MRENNHFYILLRTRPLFDTGFYFYSISISLVRGLLVLLISSCFNSLLMQTQNFLHDL